MEKNDNLREGFRRVSVLMRRNSRSEANMPSTQNRALSILNLNDGLSQRQLAYILGIRPQSSGEIIAKLEKNGWLKRKVDEKDSRVNRLYLTETGRKQAEKINNQAENDDIFDCLEEKEKEVLGGLLDKIFTNIPENDIDDFDFRMPARFRKPRMEARRMPFEEGFEARKQDREFFRKPKMETKKMPSEDDEEFEIKKSRII